MTDFELQKVLNAIKYIPSENERDEVTQIILKAASESITLDRLKQITKKGYAKVIRQIPISPMLKKVLPLIDLEQAKATNRYTIRDALKRIFPERHVHELRYSFITRAKECRCSLELVMLWSGHTEDKEVESSKVNRGYTTYSDDFYFKEIELVNYEF